MGGYYRILKKVVICFKFLKVYINYFMEELGSRLRGGEKVRVENR